MGLLDYWIRRCGFGAQRSRVTRRLGSRFNGFRGQSSESTTICSGAIVATYPTTILKNRMGTVTGKSLGPQK